MPRSILVVDDEPAVSAALADYFRSQGHEVDAAAELEEAGALLAFRRYDAAILDLRLTTLGGSEGLERTSAASAWLRGVGVRRVDRFAAMLAPGFG